MGAGIALALGFVAGWAARTLLSEALFRVFVKILNSKIGKQRLLQMIVDMEP